MQLLKNIGNSKVGRILPIPKKESLRKYENEKLSCMTPKELLTEREREREREEFHDLIVSTKLGAREE